MKDMTEESEREKENLDLKVEVKRAINMVVREAMKESRGESEREKENLKSEESHKYGCKRGDEREQR